MVLGHERNYLRGGRYAVHRQREHRVGPGGGGPRAVHDSRSRPLLRRHGPHQERPQHDDDVASSRWARSARHGSCGATARRSAPTSAAGSSVTPSSTSGSAASSMQSTATCRPTRPPARQRPAASRAAPSSPSRSSSRSSRWPWSPVRSPTAPSSSPGRSSPSIWATLVYFPAAHWVFAFSGFAAETGGWIANKAEGLFLGGAGAYDFAGGTAIHINAGVAGLALAILLRKRVGLAQGAHASAQPDARHDRRRHPVVRLVRLQRGVGPRRRARWPRASGSTPSAPPARPCSAGSSWRRSATATPRPSAPPPVSSPAWSPSPPPVRRSRPVGRPRRRPRRRCRLCPRRRPEVPLRLRRQPRRRRRPPRRRSHRHPAHRLPRGRHEQPDRRCRPHDERRTVLRRRLRPALAPRPSVPARC